MSRETKREGKKHWAPSRPTRSVHPLALDRPPAFRSKSPSPAPGAPWTAFLVVRIVLWWFLLLVVGFVGVRLLGLIVQDWLAAAGEEASGDQR